MSKLQDVAQTLSILISDAEASLARLDTYSQQISKMMMTLKNVMQGTDQRERQELINRLLLSQKKLEYASHCLMEITTAGKDWLEKHVASSPAAQYITLKTELLTALESEDMNGVEQVVVNNMDLIQSMFDENELPADARTVEYVKVPYSYFENGQWEHRTYELPIRYDENEISYSKDAVSFHGDSISAEEWAKTQYADWRSNLSDSTVEALQMYSGVQYAPINEAYRGDWTQMTKGLKNNTKQMDAGIEQATLPSDLVVYRAIGESGLVDMVMQAGGELQSGMVLQDMGYMSTSMTSDTDFLRNPTKKYILRLTAVEGLHAAPLIYGDLACVPGESEMLFGREHSIYVSKVSKIRRSDLVVNGNDDFVTLIDGILTI